MSKIWTALQYTSGYFRAGMKLGKSTYKPKRCRMLGCQNIGRKKLATKSGVASGYCSEKCFYQHRAWNRKTAEKRVEKYFKKVNDASK